jgi:hypothetical protein
MTFEVRNLGSFEHVARVGEIVLERTSEVRMPRPRRCHALMFGRISLFHGKRLLPVLPIFIFQQNGDR